MDESWITVAQHEVTEHDGWREDLFTTSILAPLDSDEVLLTTGRWLASNDFGKADVGADGDWIEVQTEKRVGRKENVRIEPFAFLRSWRDTWPSRFELIQNFILFYNLHFDATGSKYVAVDDAGETTDVVRIGTKAQHKKIGIRAKFLQNYLACRSRVLVRQHDHRMHGNKALAEFGIEPIEGRRLNDSDYVFDLTVVDGGWTGKGLAIGLLMGKDLVRSRNKCQDILSFPKGSCEFIVGVDAHGENVMEPCVDSGSELFLTLVYFESGVLKKYRDSDKYEVTPFMVSCGAHWGVQILQDGDHVIVHLGDLASVPANEQPHWQDYNVRPKVVHEHGAEPVGDGPPEAEHNVNLNIPEREDTHNEFKETFSVPVKDGKTHDVKMAVAKTVAAFTNTKGGRLFIGVNDNGKPVGLRKDLGQYKNSTDSLQLGIRDFVHSKLRVPIRMEFGFYGEDYLVIDVTNLKRRFVYIGDEFYIREGNRSRKLSPRETAEYIEGYRST